MYHLSPSQVQSIVAGIQERLNKHSQWLLSLGEVLAQVTAPNVESTLVHELQLLEEKLKSVQLQSAASGDQQGDLELALTQQRSQLEEFYTNLRQLVDQDKEVVTRLSIDAGVLISAHIAIAPETHALKCCCTIDRTQTTAQTCFCAWISTAFFGSQSSLCGHLTRNVLSFSLLLSHGLGPSMKLFVCCPGMVFRH